MKNNYFKNQTRIALTLAVLLLAACSKEKSQPVEPEKPVVDQKDIAVIDQKIDQFLADNSFPGLSIAISRNGKLVYQKGYGIANVEAAEQVSTDSRFRIASVSKLITSVAVMKLVQDNKLVLTQKVFGPDGILGTAYGKQPYKTYVGDITLSDLLHHTSGGWGQTNDPAFSTKTLDADGVINWTLDNVLLTAKPGTTFNYSNFGYMLLSKIIAKASGKSYTDYVKEQILDKVGATNTSIAGTSLATRAQNEVRNYPQGGDAGFVYDYIDFNRADGAMGWLSTPKDLLLFTNAVDGSPVRPDILNATTIGLMTTTTPASIGLGYHFGCGWVVEGDEWFWWGSLPGTFSMLYRNANGICISVTANGRRQPTPENALNGFIGITNFISTDKNIAWQDIDQF